MEFGNLATTTAMILKGCLNSIIRRSACPGLKDVSKMGSVRCPTVFPESISRSGSYCDAGSFDDDMCQIDDKDLLVGASVRVNCAVEPADLNKSFNPMCKPTDEWVCKFDESPEMKGTAINSHCRQIIHGIPIIHKYLVTGK